MKYIKSCGFVVYKVINGINFYLIIKSLNDDYGFPKGHMENNETEIQTAIRELKEETNVEVKVIDGFRKQIEYKISSINDAIKVGIYYLGLCVNDEIIIQEKEVKEAYFTTYEKALELLTFKETKSILKCAQEFIRK